MSGQALGQVLDGRAVAKIVRAEVALEAAAFTKQHGRPPGLEVVLVGEDPASLLYVRNKEKAAKIAGIRGVVHRLAANTSQDELLARVRRLNEDDGVDGILVQLPVPEGLDERTTTDAIDPSKDVDGLHPMNAGRLMAGRPGLRPCTPTGCMRLLEETGIELQGRRAIVIGRSNLVGKPIAQMLLEANCTVTMAHSRTVDLRDRVKESDIVIAAVGRPRMVKGDWIKDGAVVIDVGINRQSDGTLAGDVDFVAALERASWVTPVPRGVGPMTIAMLLRNTVRAAVSRIDDAR